MAKRAVKVAVDNRPSLAEIKANEQDGRMIYVEYRGFDKGGFVLPAHKSDFPGDPALDELLILQFEPRTLRPGWLDSPELADIYAKNPDIHIWRTSVPVEARDLTLPEKIGRSLSDSRRNLALRFAMSEYDEPMKDLVQLEPWGEGISADYSYDFLKKEFLPMLRAMKIYEQKFTARKNVLHDIDVRIKALEDAKSPDEV